MHQRQWLALTINFLLCFTATNGFSNNSVTENGHQPTKIVNGIPFQIADGLDLELVAGEPLVKWPILVDWDQSGHLIVAESAGVTKPVSEHNKLGLHRIVRLVDSDQDGHFDKRMVAVEGIGFPEGVLCLGNSILVSIPPQIMKFTDNDGDGSYEQRELWFDGQTITGCANDLHGPYFGLDGKIYWCKGAFAEQQHTLANGTEFTSSAAHIYRCNEDGTELEVIMTGGMDNPVEMAFIPEGEKFFTSTFLQHPHQGLRDGIAHAVYGGLFGKEHKVINGHPRTGDLMPIMTQLGPAAPSGLIHLRHNSLSSRQTPKDRTRTLCSALFNLHQVRTHNLKLNGSTYQTEDTTLISTSRVDFHPTDILEDADGSLIVVDTGGWYDLCCPTSRVDQKTASGGIYRITNQTTRRHRSTLTHRPVATSSALTFEQLEAPQPWVQREALRSIRDTGGAPSESAIKLITNDEARIDTKINYIWGLCCIGNQESLSICEQQLLSHHKPVVKAACHALALHKHEPARETIESLLNHSDLSIARVAAEALGRIGNPLSSTAILNSPHFLSEDRFIQHSLMYALIEITRTRSRLTVDVENLNELQLTTIINVAKETNLLNTIDSKILFSALGSQNQELQIATAHALNALPKVVNDSTEYLTDVWESTYDSPISRNVVVSLLREPRHQPNVEAFILRQITNATNQNKDYQLWLAQNFHELAPTQLDAEWISQLLTWLKHGPQELSVQIARSIAKLNVPTSSAEQILAAVLTLIDSTKDARTKISLASTIPHTDSFIGHELEVLLVDSLKSADSKMIADAIAALNRIHVSEQSAQRIVNDLNEYRPQDLPLLIESVVRSGHDESITQLLINLPSIRAARTLPRGYLKNAFRLTSDEHKKRAEEVAITLEMPDEDVRLAVEAKLGELGIGDPIRGLELFRNSKLACSNCHKMGYLGNEIGPDLTRIGSTRTREAILEAILYPSSRIEQGYETTKILTSDGLILNGMIASESDENIALRLNADRVEVITKDEIESIEPSIISIMPEGLSNLLTDQDLADLLALLSTAK